MSSRTDFQTMLLEQAQRTLHDAVQQQDGWEADLAEFCAQTLDGVRQLEPGNNGWLTSFVSNVVPRTTCRSAIAPSMGSHRRNFSPSVIPNGRGLNFRGGLLHRNSWRLDQFRRVPLHPELPPLGPVRAGHCRLWAVGQPGRWTPLFVPRGRTVPRNPPSARYGPEQHQEGNQRPACSRQP
jgi:hypothetical protein